MDEISRALCDAMVAALPGYVSELIAGRGWPELDEPTVVECVRALGDSLDALLVLPFGEQGRGPLEVFQRVVAAAPAAALAAAGVAPPDRDPATVEALPWDRYHLAPASSAALGEEAWRAHLAWGAAKAAAVSRPVCGVWSANLLDLDRIESAAASRGYRVRRLASPQDAGGEVVIVADLERAGVDELIPEAASRGIRVVAFGPHVDEFAQTRARALGASAVVPRSRFFRDPGAFLPEYA